MSTDSQIKIACEMQLVKIPVFASYHWMRLVQSDLYLYSAKKPFCDTVSAYACFVLIGYSLFWK